jgi:hypothetical protein
MNRRIVRLGLAWAGFCAVSATLPAQEFKLFSRTVQVHGFASQAFVYTNDNNWLTMNTSQGSGAFTDFGINLTSRITDKLLVGAQGYDRNLGQLGQYHPSLDWAVADYRFRSWFGVRAGKVKTTLGLYNDTQDQDFLRVFALLPQSVYPTDLRDATIAHVGADIYGSISLKHRLGDVSYTAYGGHRTNSIYSGLAYLASEFGVTDRIAAIQYGGDLRWQTPLRGLLIGASRLNEDIYSKATPKSAGSSVSIEESKADWTNQFYGEYTVGKLRIDSEYRRFFHDGIVDHGAIEAITDVRGWYVSGAYRVMKRLALGSYYSRYSITSVSGGPLGFEIPEETDTSLPANHIYDKVVSARVDLNKFWNAKVEGHFMNGYGASSFPDGFYPQVNPLGFKPNTIALVLKTSLSF